MTTSDSVSEDSTSAIVATRSHSAPSPVPNVVLSQSSGFVAANALTSKEPAGAATASMSGSSETARANSLSARPWLAEAGLGAEGTAASVSAEALA